MRAVSTVAGGTARVLAALSALTLACTEPQGIEPGLSGPAAAKPASGPTVSTAVPDNAPQDTTLEVRVLGTGFDQGSRVDLALAGVPDPINVHTNSTRFVTSTELVANITISPTATEARYDVIVTAATGKKGIGTERFLVRAVNDIGTLGGSGATARGVNAAGMIVGSSADSSGYGQAFVWTETDGMRALPRRAGYNTASGYAINDAQIVVGVSGSAPVRWVPTGTGTWDVQELGGFGGTFGIAKAINATGVIVGYSEDAAGLSRPFRWTQTGGMVALSVPSGEGYPSAINGQGTIAGWYHPTGTDQRAIAWPASGGAVELPPCSGGTMTTAYAINDADVIVGTCTRPGKRGTGGTFAARWLPDPAVPNTWLPAQVLTDPMGNLGGAAQSINNAGEIVGDGGAFFWSEAQGFRALAILPLHANGMGALGINDASVGGTFRIVGNLNSSSGHAHAVWWPHP